MGWDPEMIMIFKEVGVKLFITAEAQKNCSFICCWLLTRGSLLVLLICAGWASVGRNWSVMYSRGQTVVVFVQHLHSIISVYLFVLILLPATKILYTHIYKQLRSSWQVKTLSHSHYLSDKLTLIVSLDNYFVNWSLPPFPSFDYISRWVHTLQTTHIFLLQCKFKEILA